MDSHDGASPIGHPHSADGTATALDERERGLSRSLVEFYKRLHGRGPIAAKTLLSPGLAVTIMFEVLTPGERTLVAGNKSLDVEQMRLRTAELVRPKLINLAEEALGIEVSASITGLGILENRAVETFFLVSDDTLD